MTTHKRTLRRCAMLHFPGVSLNPETVKHLKSEGYTDVGIGVRSGAALTGQGCTLEQGKQFADMALQEGLGASIFTCYMNANEDLIRREPERAMLLADGRKTTVMCPFQPRNLEHYLRMLTETLSWPAVNEIHINDEASLMTWGNRMGCYCEHCVGVYREKTGWDPPPEPDWNSENWAAWIAHRLDNWSAVHREIKDRLQAIRPDVLVGIQHHWVPAAFARNPWRSAVDLGRDGATLDLLSTDPYHFYEPSKIFKQCRPFRRILTESVRSLLGATLKRRATVWPQAFAPPRLGYELSRLDGLLAGIVPFALGADKIIPYTYELSKIIPGFFEAFMETRALTPLLEATAPWHGIRLLASMQTAVYGHPEDNWCRDNHQDWMEVMRHTGLAWRWIYDARLEDAPELIGDVLVIPDAHCLTAAQLAVIDRHAENGGGILWIGRMPAEPWAAHTFRPPGSELDPGPVELELTGSHPATVNARLPVMLAAVAAESMISGDTHGLINGQPALVSRTRGKGREAWLAGMPLYSYVRPGDNALKRTPTGGIDLLRGLFAWLAQKEPLIELTPFPPPNAYGDLRPWDARDVPTMELFPLRGDRQLAGIVFNYMPLAYRTNLVFRLAERPPAAALHVQDLFNGISYAGKYTYAEDTGTLSIPLDVDNRTELLAIQVSW